MSLFAYLSSDSLALSRVATGASLARGPGLGARGLFP
jgi:hypothetical protein